MKFAYITMLTNQHYLPGVWVLARSLQAVNAKYPLFVVIPEDRETELLPTLTKWGLQALTMPRIEVNASQRAHYWGETFFKLQSTGLIQFQKIILIDSDMVVLRNLDHLFQSPHMSAVAAGKFVSPDWVRLNSGLIVLEPSELLNRKLLESIEPTIHQRTLAGLAAGDQDVFNFVYPQWPKQKELHLSEAYNAISMDIDSLCKHLFKNGYRDIYVAHFIGKEKPWTYGKKRCIKICIKHILKGNFAELRALWRYRAYLKQLG